ncbi:MAG: hypothetical protein ACRCS3_12235 [Paracoccaceae bacterium]
MDHRTSRPSDVAPDVAGALRQSPAFQALTPSQQRDMSDAMSRVFGYLDRTPARPFAPNFDELRGGGSSTSTPPPSTAPAAPAAPTGAAPAAAGANAFQRAAGATREMLGAVAFPEVTASLIQGTFQAIVDSSIQQMEAYSRLLAETAKTVDQFMADNISDDMAKDHLTSNYSDIFAKDLSSGSPQMTVRTDAVAAGQLPSFLKDLGFDSPADLDATAINDVVIPEARYTLAEMRHQSLATMVMMGINRIVVSDGEINAKLVFHVDASESTSLTFSDYKPTSWTMAGKLGGNSFGASGVLVNTTNLNAQSDVNMKADLTGEVRVRFKSDYFPLERFADSAAIQLISSRAKIAAPSTPAAATAPAPATAAPVLPAQPALPAVPPAPTPPAVTP